MTDVHPPLVLAYHGVAEVPLRKDPGGLFVRPRDLVRHVERLRSWGYALLAFGAFADCVARGEGAGRAALTFDDGLVDNLETLVPLLREAEAPATVFAVSGWLGRPYPWGPWTRLLTASEVRALAEEGVEIGSHTVSHRDLSTLSYEESLSELAESKSALEQIVRSPVEVAAYPYGHRSPEAIRACRDAGYRAACTTSGRGSWDDPHDLPRQDMDNRCTMLGLRLKRDGRYEPLMGFPVGRAARRLRRRLLALAE
jgi:peptidoglycan/xylan/chitin deacetylase (PgdA/CDA1 family)